MALNKTKSTSFDLLKLKLERVIEFSVSKLRAT